MATILTHDQTTPLNKSQNTITNSPFLLLRAATHGASIAGPRDLVSAPARCRGPSRGPQRIFRYPRLKTRVRPRMRAGFAMRPDSRRGNALVGPPRRYGV